MSQKSEASFQRLLKMLQHADISLMQEQQLVLELLCQQDKHFTPQEVQSKLRGHGHDVPLSMIKETLELLVHYGIAHRREFAELGTAYERRHPTEHHDHLICVKCSTIEEFHADEVEKLQEQIAQRHGFRPLWHRQEIYGLCSRCKQQKGKRLLPLSQATVNKQVCLVGIAGGRGLRKRLSNMGLLPGQCLKVLNKSGPFLIEFGGTRLAIGFGMAEKILVSEE